MSERLKPKQINKILAAPIRVAGVVVPSTSVSTIITTEVTAALNTAGYNSKPIPLLYSTSDTSPGIIKDINNRVEIYSNTTGNKIEFQGNEVYGRLTESSGVITLNYYYLLTGVETSYTFLTATTIDFEFNYRFEFKDLPTDSIIAIKQRNVQDDIPGSTGKQRIEKLTVSSLNNISALSIMPLSNKRVRLLINGYQLESIATNPAFTVVGTAITWNSINAGWDVETTDEVIAEYFTA